MERALACRMSTSLGIERKLLAAFAMVEYADAKKALVTVVVTPLTVVPVTLPVRSQDEPAL